MWCWHRCDEKLRPIGVRACVGHGKNPRDVVNQSKLLVLELVPVDAVSSETISPLKVPSLEHEARDDSVYLGAFITKARLPSAELSEVLCGPGHHLIEQFYLNSPKILPISSQLQVNFGSFLFA